MSATPSSIFRALGREPQRQPARVEPRPQLLSLAADPEQWFLLQPPPRVDAEAPLMVSVHGVTRNALEHAQAFSTVARERGAALLVPIFDERRNRRYQRLGRERSALRSDLGLLAMVGEARARLHLNPTPLRLFGYSGGGQFVHRFAMLYPELVARVAVGAAGWYTFPDANEAFPHGLGDTASASLPAPRMDALLRVPAAVFVGVRDDEHDAKFNACQTLVAQQGINRIERGQRWIAAMRTAARSRGFSTDYRFELLPECDHSFTRCVRRGGLRERVIDFLFPVS